MWANAGSSFPLLCAAVGVKRGICRTRTAIRWYLCTDVELLTYLDNALVIKACLDILIVLRYYRRFRHRSGGHCAEQHVNTQDGA